MSKEQLVDFRSRAEQGREALRGLSNVKDLLALMQGGTVESFPFCRNLASYLLFVVSLWPNNQQRLLEAARLFSGALNYHVARTPKDFTFRDGDSIGGYERVTFGSAFSAAKLKTFNRMFFERIGGLESLLFCSSMKQFHRDICDRTQELKIVHDVIEFLIKSARVLPSNFRSASFAYEAISRNVFSREGGYGISFGPKRRRDVGNEVTTVGSVREKWKHAPDTVILSYVLTELYQFPRYSLANLASFVSFSVNARKITQLRLLLSSIADQLIEAKATQNKSITKWTASLDVSPQTKPFVLFGFSENELERVFKIDNALHKKPLSLDEQLIAREKRKTRSTGWAGPAK